MSRKATDTTSSSTPTGDRGGSRRSAAISSTSTHCDCVSIWQLPDLRQRLAVSQIFRGSFPPWRSNSKPRRRKHGSDEGFERAGRMRERPREERVERKEDTHHCREPPGPLRSPRLAGSACARRGRSARFRDLPQGQGSTRITKSSRASTSIATRFRGRCLGAGYLTNTRAPCSMK